MKLVLTATIIFLMIPGIAISGGAAPYTKDAVEKIYTIQKSSGPPKYDKNLPHEERRKKWVDYERKTFLDAGYNYDETIDQVVNDMRYHPDRIPQVNAQDSVFGYINVTLNMMLSDCKSSKIDCLQFFPAKTAESVKWLSENISFSF